MAPLHITVLGGGLTGLSSAFHLSRRFPSSPITLLEKQSRLGGWVRSEKVQIRPQDEDGTSTTVVLEAGPRTLRPNAKSVLELINLLGLIPSIITTPRTAPAAKARFLHIPGTSGLVSIPSSVLSVLFSPLRPILLSAVLREPFRRSNRPPNIADESLDAFMTRRFGEPFARTFGSALAHGIYAADSRKLSVRAAFPSVWDAESDGWGSVVRGLLRHRVSKSHPKSDYDLGNTVETMRGVSVYSFRDGMETLTSALEHYLCAQRNIRILRNTSVASLVAKKDKPFEILLSSGKSLSPTHVVSSISLPALHTILASTNTLPHLRKNPSSSVSVINLVFPEVPYQIHPEGFGYLVPRPTSDYSPTSPSILGTIFDSCSLHAQDSPTHANVTKMTVMLGGPYPTLTAEHTSLPSIMRHLEAHLQKRLPQPLFWKVWRNVDCIPTLMPGHLDRMAEMKDVLRGGMWGGRMEVVGAGVGGVSVGDCVEAGKRAGEHWT